MWSLSFSASRLTSARLRSSRFCRHSSVSSMGSAKVALILSGCGVYDGSEVHEASALKPEEFDALVIPGGFGAAKNLCDWAVRNTDCTVNKDVESTIKKFHSLKKPIGLTCIAPVLAAKCIPGVKLTVGQTEEQGGKWPYSSTAGAMEKCGAQHIPTEVTEAHVDKENKVVTTAAFMHDGPVHLVYDGIGQLVSKVIELTKEAH